MQQTVYTCLEEANYDELLNFQDSNRFSEREKAALTWTSAIMWV